jgi:uncharacterized repeat protein (TIGR01451 family)
MGDDLLRFAYNVDLPPTIEGLPPGLRLFGSGTYYEITGSPTQTGVYTYTISVQDPGCTTNSATGTITIVDNCCSAKRVTGNAVSGNGWSSACLNSPINPISYNVGLNSTVMGLPPGLSFNTNAYPPSIEGTPNTKGDYTYTLVSTGNNCNTRTVITGISVANCLPCQISPKTTSGPTIQTICKGTPISNISYDALSSFKVLGLPPGLTFKYNSIVCCCAPCPSSYLEISGTPTVEGVYTYTLVPEGGRCIQPGIITGTITVLPLSNSTTTTNVCDGFISIRGYVYHDNNGNCTMDSTDKNIDNIHLKLYDGNNNLIAHRYSSSGAYDFTFSDPDGGNYIVELDPEGQPISAQCTTPGLTIPITVPTTNSEVKYINFNIECKAEIGIQSIAAIGRVFPGQQHQLNVYAGDLGRIYNIACEAKGSGTLQITVNGPVKYNGAATGTLSPTVQGNVFTYTISNWATLNMKTDLGLLFITDTTAKAGEDICVKAVITTSGSDFNPNNNSYTFCYKVNNSYDPNLKEVYPVDLGLGFMDWLDYTIHFQNTGNAPAINIRLGDTLDANLDLETFQVINSSHTNSICIYNNLLSVYFPNIELPDSISDPEGSKGFIQYRFKPKPNLPLGTKIKNTANIYFDFNAAVVTNTTVNEYKAGVTSITENKNNASLNIYPNPNNGSFKIESANGGNYSIINELGEIIKEIKLNNTNQNSINIDNLSNGVYFVVGINNDFITHKKIVVIK